VANLYCTVADLKAELQVSDAADDALFDLAASAASRQIDTHCGRRFWQDATATARTFRPDDAGWLLLPDVHTITGLVVKIDSDGDGVFETTVPSTDYELGTVDDIARAWPYTELELVGDYRFPGYSRRRSVQITARWGWSSIPDDVQKACRIQAAQLYKAKDTAFGVAGFGEFGVLRVQARMNPLAAALLAGYRRPAVG
jgi:hypothetical protein